MNIQQKLYAKVKGLRLRKSPDSADTKNVISELDENQELTFVDGPWIKVSNGNQEGWVHADYVSESVLIATNSFKKGVPNLSKDVMTVQVRKEIADEYGGGKNGWELQCTEYVTYRVKTKLGVVIKWPVKTGRNGGKWGSIFKASKTYPVSDEPIANRAMSFTTGISSDPAINEIGHVAFVEEVNPDGSIRISEANWPRNGIYNERMLTKAEWKDKYKGSFVSFA